jgi:4-hydroxy-tetrahydrodipicolinate synthase
MMVPQFRGILPPMVTPFTADEEVDEAALREETRVMLAAGVHGLCVCGSTGEGHTLTAEESCAITRIVREEAAGRVPVIAGIIQDSTREVIRYGRALREAGADALQVTPVHYLFSPTEEGTIDYYRRIGEAVGLPILIYNVIPWNTISPDLLLRLAEIEQVVGVKQSGGDIHKLADLLKLNRGRLQIFTAVDDLLYPSFLLGAEGAIAAILTVLPELCVQLWDACQTGRHDEARAIHERLLPVWRAINAPDMSARTKAAIALQGRRVGQARHPLLPVSDDVRGAIREALAEAGVVGAGAVRR